MDVSTSVTPRQRPKPGQAGVAPATGVLQLPTPATRGRGKPIAAVATQGASGNSEFKFVSEDSGKVMNLFDVMI